MFYVWVEKENREIFTEWLKKHGLKRVTYQLSDNFIKIPIEVRERKNFDKSKIWQHVRKIRRMTKSQKKSAAQRVTHER